MKRKQKRKEHLKEPPKQPEARWQAAGAVTPPTIEPPRSLELRFFSAIAELEYTANRMYEQGYEAAEVSCWLDRPARGYPHVRVSGSLTSGARPKA
jgi:hypothetical protein